MASADEKNPPGDDSSSDSLDCLSAKFDPLKALYSETVCVPEKKCRIYDNLATFEAALEKLKSGSVNMKKSEALQVLPPNAGASCSTHSTDRGDTASASNRRFLPHQMALQSTWKLKKKHSRNLLLKMKEFDGPLATVNKYVEEKRKVKIYTRKEKGIRGYMIGIIVAFDVHWNLLLEDVYEVWKRRKHKFSENNMVLGEPVKFSNRLKELGIDLPEIEVKSLNRKYVECRRKVNQVLIRGEQIVLMHPVAHDTE